MNTTMIVKAWLDEGYRATLTAQGFEVPPRPEDLTDEQLDLFAEGDREHGSPAAVSFC